MKLAWLTDIHLNFLTKNLRKEFALQVKESGADATLITGDISEWPTLKNHLTELKDATGNMAIFYILGNHDFWRTSVQNSEEELKQYFHTACLYLPQQPPLQIAQESWLVGVNGWADAQLGDYDNSNVLMNDAYYIRELADAAKRGKNPLKMAMQFYANRDADLLKHKLIYCTKYKPKHILVATHIPPFKECSLYRGEVSNDDYLPFYTCKAIGDVLLEFAKENPTIEVTTLCGHSHSDAIYLPLANLTVRVGEAEYGDPKIQCIIDASTMDCIPSKNG